MTDGKQLIRSDTITGAHVHGQRSLLALSFSALGVIYGDIGTSPLYAYQAVFTAPPDRQRTLSAASLFFWTLTLIVLVKYVGIVLRFDDNGEGGTFALYSLICRAAGFGPFGPAKDVDSLTGAAASAAAQQAPGFIRGHWWSLRTGAGARVRKWYRRSRGAQVALLVVVMVATAMVIGDGVLTPSISVLSAISGIKVATDKISQPAILGITIAVLVLLFSVQRLGTGKVSIVFAPVITVWLLFNAALGFYNLSTYGWGAWEALNPAHAIEAFRGEGGFEAGWHLLAGVMLCITGAEAMYADLGHFNAAAVTLSFCTFVYPCLIVTYMGQAAYLIARPDGYSDPFWMSVPTPAFWPMMVVATLASIVASQALISGCMSIMRQAMALGVLPRLKIDHTDELVEGQIYIGQINTLLLLGCIAMVAGFQDTTSMGHAYGVAVISVMFITAFLSALVMLACYDLNPIIVLLYMLVFVPIEGLFLSSNAIKIPEGGWVTIAIAVAVASIKLIWWYGSLQKRKWLRQQAEANTRLFRELPDATQEAAATAAAPAGASAAGLVRRPAAAAAALGPLREGSQESLAASFSMPVAAGAGGGTGASGGKPAPLASASAMPAYNRGDKPECVPGGGARGAAQPALAFRDRTIVRVPGMAIIYAQNTDGIPAVLGHMLTNSPAAPRVCVLLTLRFVPLPYVPESRRFLVQRVKLLGGAYRVVARYGYMEAVDHGAGFVRRLVGCLVRHVAGDEDGGDGSLGEDAGGGAANGGGGGRGGEEDVAARGDVVVNVPQGGAAAGGGERGQEGPARRSGPWFSVTTSAEDDAALSSMPTQDEERQLGRASIQQVASMMAAAPPLLAPAELAASSRRLSKASSDLGTTSVRAQLGRESISRWEYRQQSLNTARLSTPGVPRRLGTFSVGGAPPASPAAAPPPAGALAALKPPHGGGAGLTAAQLDEIGVLLDCYRQRTVYVVGGTRVAPRLKGVGSRNPLRRVVLAAYGFLSNNTQPATLAWKVPDEQLLEVTLLARL